MGGQAPRALTQLAGLHGKGASQTSRRWPGQNGQRRTRAVSGRTAARQPEQRRPGAEQRRSAAERRPGPGQRRPGAATARSRPTSSTSPRCSRTVAQGRNGNGLPRRHGGSTGTFTTQLRRRTRTSKRNTDNVIVAPGVSATAPTTCTTTSATRPTTPSPATRTWPAARHHLPEPGRQVDLLLAGAAPAGRHGRGRRRTRPAAARKATSAQILTPSQVADQVRRQPAEQGRRDAAGSCGSSPVTPRPSPTATRTPTPHWSCTGFEDRQLTDKYPICPAGQRRGAHLRLPELLGRPEHRQRQPPDARGLRRGATAAAPTASRPSRSSRSRLVYDVHAPSIQNGRS